MKGMPAAITRTLAAAALAAGLAACSDVTTSDPLSPSTPRRLVTGGSELLTSSQTLTPTGSTGVNAVTYSVTMPASGPIYLTFNGRINYGSTAGNSNVLKIVVNDITVTGTLKSSPSSYTYAGSWSEPYWDNRGGSYGQPEYLWGLFWSPDFSSNTNSGNSYYVSSPSNPYYYEFNITGLVRYSQANNITIRNLGGWVTTLTGSQPNAVLQNISVRNY
jgi:hypothetical protein